MNNKPKVLIVADRAGWAIDRLTKPVAEICDNVEMSYFSVSDNRYLDTGYSKRGGVLYNPLMANKYDVVHYHRVPASYNHLDKVTARKIVTLHTERIEDFKDYDLDKYDDIICLTRYMVDEVAKLVEKANVHYCPVGIDLERYKFAWKQPDDKVIGYCGRVLYHKRFATIKKAVFDAGLRLNGCGYINDPLEFDAYNDIIKEGRDFNYVIFLPEPQMVDFYSKMNLFVCLSEPHIEAGPLPVLEAMACGIPVISTRVGWAVDHCTDHGNIWFVDEGNIDELKDTILMVYNDRGIRRRLRDNGLRLIKEFSLDNYVKNLNKIYEN